MDSQLRTYSCVSNDGTTGKGAACAPAGLAFEIQSNALSACAAVTVSCYGSPLLDCILFNSAADARVWRGWSSLTPEQTQAAYLGGCTQTLGCSFQYKLQPNSTGVYLQTRYEKSPTPGDLQDIFIGKPDQALAGFSCVLSHRAESSTLR